MLHSMLHLSKKLSRLSLLLCIAFVLSACVKEDLSGCQHELSIRFEYTLNNRFEDLFSEQVTFLDLLIYNQDRDLVNKYQILRNNLFNGNTCSLPNLREGEYTLVVWANATDQLYTKNYISKLTDMRVGLKLTPNNEAAPIHGSLFYGSTYVSFNKSTVYQPTISLTKNTNLVHILIEEVGSNKVLQLSDYQVEITGSNGTYNFENKTVDHKNLNYKAAYAYPEEHTLQVDFTLLRLLIGDDVKIKIRDSESNILYEDFLVNKIRMIPNIQTNNDLDRYDEYTLKFEIEKDDNEEVKIDLISVNDWILINQNGGLS